MALPAPPGLSRCISSPGHPTTWSVLESRYGAEGSGTIMGSPGQARVLPTPFHACGQGLQLQPRVLAGKPSSPRVPTVLVAEIVKHFRPRLVDLHSYIPACSTDQKLSNWSLLNRKVFRKLHLCISDNDIQRVVSNRPGVIESILCALREKMEARTVQDPGHSGVDAVQPWGELTSHPHTTKIQDPNVDNCSLSEPLWDFCREDHYIPESWAHDDLELPNLHKKAGTQLKGSGITWSASSSSWRIRSKH